MEVLTHVKQLGPSLMYELHESKLQFAWRIEFMRSKLSNFSAYVIGIMADAPNVCSGCGPQRMDNRTLYAGDTDMSWYYAAG